MFDQYKPIEKWETRELAHYVGFINSSILVQMVPIEQLEKLEMAQIWSMGLDAIELYREAMKEIEKRKEDYEKSVETLNNLI
jgi:hypothetical protein